MSNPIDYSQGIYDAKKLGTPRMLILGAQHMFAMFGATVLVPLLTLLRPLEESEVFPSSITIILPVCLVTLAVSAAVGTVPWQDALPYLFGSAAGGWAAGMWGRKIPVKWLHRGLGILILWGGYRYLCC